jgi:hypothetical protein
MESLLVLRGTSSFDTNFLLDLIMSQIGYQVLGGSLCGWGCGIPFVDCPFSFYCVGTKVLLFM